jgi:hypothetical protein
MKKILILFACITILTSCKKEEVTLEINKDNDLSGLYGHIKTIRDYSITSENNKEIKTIKSVKTYDQEGKKIEIKRYSNNRINKITRLIYEYGRLTKTEEYDSKGKIHTYTNKEYQGEILNLETTYGKDDVPDSKTEYEYENEKLKTINIYYFNASIQKFVLSVIFSYSYKEDGKIEKIKKFYTKIGTTEIYSNISKEIFTCFENDENRRTTNSEYIYDSKKKDYTIFHSKYKKRYNINGYETKYTEISEAEIELNSTSLIYIKDGRNNWVKAIIKINEVEVKNYLTREYSFFNHSLAVKSN